MEQRSDAWDWEKSVARSQRGRRRLARVLYYQRTRVPKDMENSLGATYCSFEDLLAQSDYVSIHLPSNKSTEALIDADALARMKDGAYLINISRASIIDRRALMAVLESDRLGGVALDVHYEEPSPENEPLKNYPKALDTPHRRGGAGERRRRYGRNDHNLAAAI